MVLSNIQNCLINGIFKRIQTGFEPVIKKKKRQTDFPITEKRQIVIQEIVFRTHRRGNYR